MHSILLALALCGQCGPAGCPAPTQAWTKDAQPEWADYSVRVIVDHGGTSHLGSGTVVGSGEGDQKLIITARHVIGSARQGISVRHRGSTYPARFLAIGDEGDIAAISADIPGSFPDLRIADTAPSRAIMLGYGSNGQLHKHMGNLTGYATPRGDRSPDMAFSFGAESGDSGGGVYNADGEFCGVLWGSRGAAGAMAVSTAKVHRFLNVQRTDLTPSTPGSRGKSVTISPFFFKIKKWNNLPSGSVVVEQQPPLAPSTPPPAAVAGSPGPQGPPGPAGKDAPAVDLSAITNRLAALEAGQKAITDTMGKISQAVVRPITVNVAKSDGTVSTGQAQLGSTINLDVADKAIVARLAAIEARLATPSK